ncbi:histidine phosphatase family protein [Oceanobacillus salinisoli]|uniref:histidine phosphatase family protein n=1 Tax=Oceanobacillus salinisoli TaxID=2678611 RepID=UPI001E406ED5|nr:histidine phosphatase family protein [Oceanobacillus salinisoli]
MAITLFRHGLTEGNQQKNYMGWNDSPLCTEAIQDLSSYKLKMDTYDLFVSSDLKRCLSTINLLFPNVKPVVLTELREMNFGMFQGKTYEDLKEMKAYQQWINNMFTYSPPGGETFEQFTKRVEKGWNKLVDIMLQRDYQKLFIVTHGGVIRYLLDKLSLEEKEFWEWNIPHGTGYVLTFDRKQLRRGAHCVSLQEVPLTGNEHG